MRPSTITLTGTGSTLNSSPFPVDYRNQGISLSFDTDGSTTGFTVQYTLEPPENYASASAYNSGAKWHSHAGMSGMTADDDDGLVLPVRAIRLQADANGTDTGNLHILAGVS